MRERETSHAFILSLTQSSFRSVKKEKKKRLDEYTLVWILRMNKRERESQRALDIKRRLDGHHSQ